MQKSKKINICIIRNDRMGDMILTLPVIKEIKCFIPNIRITVICSKFNFFLCKEANFVDTVYIYDKGDDIISKIKFLKKFKKLSYDYVFNFSQDIETSILLLLSNSVKRSSLLYLSRYKNPNISKLFQRLLLKLFKINHIIIDRNYFFNNKINFHQTIMMYKLVKEDLFIKKPRPFHSSIEKNHAKKIFQKRILLHLSNRWIDDKYNEDNFFELLNELTNKYDKLYLSTDQKSSKAFKKVYNSFVKYNDQNLHKLYQNSENIIILDKLNFKNWRSAIMSSKLVITFECGCVHVASMSNIPLIVVYDFKNKPDMINKEYAPYTEKYEKVIVNQKQINKKIITILNNNNSNIYCRT